MQTLHVGTKQTGETVGRSMRRIRWGGGRAHRVWWAPWRGPGKRRSGTEGGVFAWCLELNNRVTLYLRRGYEAPFLVRPGRLPLWQGSKRREESMFIVGPSVALFY